MCDTKTFKQGKYSYINVASSKLHQNHLKKYWFINTILALTIVLVNISQQRLTNTFQILHYKTHLWGKKEIHQLS